MDEWLWLRKAGLADARAFQRRAVSAICTRRDFLHLAKAVHRFVKAQDSKLSCAAFFGKFFSATQKQELGQVSDASLTDISHRLEFLEKVSGIVGSKIETFDCEIDKNSKFTITSSEAELLPVAATCFIAYMQLDAAVQDTSMHSLVSIP